MTVYKSPSGNMYEDWVSSGPIGSVFTANKSGWFNMKEFETFFQKIFLPYLRYTIPKEIDFVPKFKQKKPILFGEKKQMKVLLPVPYR